MKREIDLYERCNVIFKKLKAGAPMPDALKGMDVSENTAKLRTLAEENQHFALQTRIYA